ncbi:MAG: LCP family protein, partial [bacterium]|nr:LCP family protein [bacterium]
LKGEGEGRVNILLLGVGDPAHAGADLTDTMIVISLDPRTNDVAMLSIPRDLYVKISGYGSDRINAAHSLAEMKKRGTGPDLAKKTVSETLDIPIHYYVRIDFTGLKKAVDTVGGVDINVEKDLYDPYYPCDRNENLQCVFRVKKGLVHMDGAMALKYARSRETTSDFDRARRQQQVLTALRDKALQLSTISNPGKISGLIDIMGSHIKTDLALWEINKLAEISKKVDAAKIINKVLDNSPDNYLRDANINGAYVLLPKTGNFKAIQAFVRSIFVDSYIKQEDAKIQVENGTARSGLASQAADLLKSFNYNVVGIASADRSNYQATVIYDYTNGAKPYTIKYLENRFDAKAIKTDPPKNQDGSSSLPYDIKIIIGANYQL